MLRTHRLLLLLLISGVILRLIISLTPGIGDINNHIVWARDVIQHGSFGLYDRPFKLRLGVIEPNYPPLSIALFVGVLWTYTFLIHAIWWLNITISIFPSFLVQISQDPRMLSAIMRLPAIMADVGVALMIYKYMRAAGRANWLGLAGVALVMYNPAFFYNSASLGQIESIPLFFVLVSLYVLLYGRKHSLRGPLLLFAAIMTKQTAVLFVPVFIVAYLRRYTFYEGFKALCILLILWVVLFLPFTLHPFITYVTKILTASGLPYASNHAFNLWALFTNFQSVPDARIFWLGMSYSTWGSVIAFFIIGIIVYHLWKRRSSKHDVIFASFLVAITVFLVLTRMHERHLEMSLPFLLLVALERRRYMPVFLYMSLFHSINVYHNRWYPPLGMKEILSAKPVLIMLIGVTLGVYSVLLKQYIIGSKK